MRTPNPKSNSTIWDISLKFSRLALRLLLLVKLLLLAMLWLQRMIILLIRLTQPRRSKALPDLHISFRLGHQRIPNILFAPRHPTRIIFLAKWPHRHIPISTEKLLCNKRRLGSDSVDVHFEFFAKGFEGEIVDIVAEGVLDFAADGGEPDDYVGGEYAPGDGDPFEVFDELEGEHEHVDPGYLRDGDGVGDWEGGGEDAVHAD